jgi:hypothetical protein
MWPVLLTNQGMIRTSRHLIRTLAALLLLAIPAVHLAADPVPAFLIESIEVEGGSRAVDRIVIAESRLHLKQTYDESELRAAMARIQRLPFVVSTDFRLAKGTVPGTYVLIIRVRRMTPFFLDAETNAQWTHATRLEPLPSGGYQFVTRIERRDEHHIVAGARTFLGANGVVTATAERVSLRNDRYTLTLSEYDLFGSRASVTAVMSYLEAPGANRSGDPLARNDWHHRDNVLYEIIGVIPITGSDSLRGSWQHEELPGRYNAISPQDGQYHYVLQSLPEISKELFWIHDTTNDPLLPTSGTRWTLGGTRISMPTTTTTTFGTVQARQLAATFEHTVPVFDSQALTVGGTGLQFNRVVHDYTIFALYGYDLSSHVRSGDLRLELGGRKEIFETRVQRTLHSHRTQRSSQAFVNASAVYRNVWGVLRFTVEYEGWEKQ